MMRKSFWTKGIIGLVALAMLAGCAGSAKTTRHSKWNNKQFSQNKLPKFDIPVVVNDRVVVWIDYFTGSGRRHFERYLTRSGRYVPEMQEILRKNGLPQDLVYLALIESGFSAKAYSRARAAGHWQFIGSTGKRYDLDINHWVDERRDPHDSTQAAANYLKDLYNMFGDWYLAIAAYNAGEGKIQRGINMTGSRDFWEMTEKARHYIRPETRDYVPKFLAAAIIAKSPERFGFGNVVYDTPPVTEKAKVDTQTDLQVVAKCAGVETSLIEDLNPELTRGATPPGVRNYEIVLPKGRADDFYAAYSKVPESERLMVLRHNVRKGESIQRIARRYGVSVREIMAANDLGSGKLKKGMSLIIPKGGETKQIVSDIVASDSGRPRGKAVKHTVQRGETLSLIAQNYGVDVSSVKKWNKLKRERLHKGQVLKIYGVEDAGSTVVASKGSKNAGKKGATHTVRRGDSWWKVAQKYGVSINDLKNWNPTLGANDLKAGNRIKLYGPSTAIPKEEVKLGLMEGGATKETATSNMTASNDIQSKPIQSDMLSMRAENVQVASNTDAVPSQSIATQSQVSVAPVPKELSYKMKNGDTLWDIAKKYNVSVKDIMEWNNLGGGSHKKLKPGDTITLRVK